MFTRALIQSRYALRLTSAQPLAMATQSARGFSNFFYSSSEEEGDSWDGDSSVPSYGDEFRIQRSPNGRAVYQAEYVTYYLPLMKKAIGEAIGRIPFRERTEYIPDPRNLQAMVH